MYPCQSLVKRMAVCASKTLPSNALIDVDDLVQGGVLASLKSRHSSRIYGSMVDQARLMTPIVTYRKAAKKYFGQRTIQGFQILSSGCTGSKDLNRQFNYRFSYDPWPAIEDDIMARRIVESIFSNVQGTRRLQVMELCMNGYSNTEIGKTLGITLNRVLQIWTEIREQLGTIKRRTRLDRRPCQRTPRAA